MPPLPTPHLPASESASLDSEAGRRLVEAIRAGDASAFKALYLAYHQRLLEYAAGLLDHTDGVKDAVQDCFVRLWMKRETLDITGRADVYLYRAVRYNIIDIRRRQSRTGRIHHAFANLDDTLPGRGNARFDADAGVVADETEQMIDHAIATLPAAEREVVLLRWRHGFSNAEIAEVSGRSAGAVAVYLSRAREAIRRALEEME